MSKPTDSLPHSDQCEKGLLGSFIHSPEKVYDKCQFRNVTEKWFYHPDHGKFFIALGEMKKHGMFAPWQEQKEKHLDYLIPVTQYCLDHAARLNIATSNLSEVVTGFYTTVNTAAGVDHYIDTLQKKWAKRSALIESLTLTEKIKQSVDLDDLHQLVAGPFSEAKELCSVVDKTDYDRKAQMAFLDKMEAIATGVEKPEFFPTGLPSIDDECGGLARGELVMIRGQRGCGKSLLSSRMVSQNAFSDRKRKVALFTYEMPYDQCLKRFIADMGSINQKSMRNGTYNKLELQSFHTAMNRIMESNLKIYDTERLKRRTPNVFFSMVRRHHKNHGLDMVVLDHMHLLKFDGKSDKRTDEAYHELSAEFKSVCLELRIVGILLAQENSEGGTFGSTQVETDVDTSLSLTAVTKVINNKKRIVGTDGAFCDKCRDGDLLGRKIPLIMTGQFARIEEDVAAVGK